MKKKLLLLLALVLMLACAALASCDMIDDVTSKIPFLSKPATTTTAAAADPFANVTFADVTGTYDGEAKTMAVANLPAGAVVVYSIDGADAVASVSIVDAGTYTVEAQMTSATGEVATKTATMTIAKADYTLENAEQYFAADATVPYDGGFHTPEPIVDLPAGLSFMSDAAPISNPGESATYNISFAFSDPTLARNYNPPAGISGIKLTIGKAAFDLSAVTFEDVTVAYDGGSKKLEVANLPTSLRVTYTYKDAAGATVKGFPVNRGQYTVTATFAFKSAADAALYELPAPLTATLTIGAGVLSLPNLFEDKTVAYSGNSLYPVIPMIDGVASTTVVVKNANGEVVGENDVKLPGVYDVTVSFVVADSAAYQDIDPISYKLTITKAPVLVTSTPVWAPVGGWDVIVGDGGYFLLDDAVPGVAITLPAVFDGLDVEVTYVHTVNSIATEDFDIAGLYTTTAIITLTSDLYVLPEGYTAGTFTWLLSDKEVNDADINFADKTETYNGEAFNIELGYEGVAGILGATVVVTDENGNVVDATNGFVAAGVYTYTVTFETDAAAGYAPLTIVKTLTIEKAMIDLSGIEAAWDFALTEGKAFVWFDGENHEVKLNADVEAALADLGVTVSYSGNKAKAIGEYTAIATLVCDGNHALSVEAYEFDWQIARADADSWTPDPVQ